MRVWKLFFVCLWAVVRGHYKARVAFDTEAQHYDSHLVPVDRGFIENFDEGILILSENAPHRSYCPKEKA